MAAALPGALLSACSRGNGPLLVASRGTMPKAWLASLPAPWSLNSTDQPQQTVEAATTGPTRNGLLQLSDGWAKSLDPQLLQPLGAPRLLARLAAAAAPVSRLYAPPGAAALAFPWAFSPWVIALRNEPRLVHQARSSWDVLLEPALRGKLVLPSSPRVSIELMGADPGRLRQLRAQALAYDDAHGLNLLLRGDARAAVLPLQPLVPLLRRDPRLQVVLPATGAPLSWQLLLRPAGSVTPLPLAWLEAVLDPGLLPQLLAQGWVPPLPRAALEPVLQQLPQAVATLLLPSDAVLQRCWSLSPLGQRQQLAWQTLWDAAAP